MTSPPRFPAEGDPAARTGDVASWRPVVEEILVRHGLASHGRTLVAGFNATHPTFVCGDVVVKLFGAVAWWRTAHAAERAALSAVAADPEILAPRIVAEGRSSDAAGAAWPYLVTTRMHGVPWREAALSAGQRSVVAAELGAQVRRVHALRPGHAAVPEDWQGVDVAAAARRSSLPERLIAQIDGFLARIGPPDPVLVHGDLVANHVYVSGGRLAGVIDWGDAVVADRHLELIQVHRDLFDCDKPLLRTFLDASAWPVGGDFARRALAEALRRQAMGLAQHGSMDVFEPVAARLPLGDLATLDDLAVALFGVRGADAPTGACPA